ncbi:MAG: sugar ABC transporter substrate-binding protein, partial [Rhodothermales bacterium]
MHLARTPIYFFLLAGLVLAPLGGCESSEERADADGQDGKPTIALIMKSLANEFFATMAEGAEAHHAAHAGEYDLVVNGIRNESDLSQQVALVEQMIARGVDAVVIAPADSRALVPVLQKAEAAGLVVVNIDNKLDDETLAQAGLALPFVGPDNQQGARLVGEALAEQLQPGDEIAILEGIPTAFNAQQRRRGCEEAMQEAGVEVVDVQSGEWEQGKANTVASAMLREHPGLDALLCSNDNMALGAAAAVKQAGKGDQVAVVGFDNIEAVQEMIRGGRVLATADQHADQLAVFGIEYALQILNGEATPKDKETPVDLVTADDLAE